MTDILFHNIDFEEDYKPPSIIQILNKQDSEELIPTHFQHQEFIYNTKKEITYQNFSFQKDVKLVDDQSQSVYPFKNVNFNFKKMDNETSVPFKSIITSIENSVKFPFEQFLISVQDPSSKMFIFIEDINNKKIDFKAFQSMPQITIRLKQNQQIINNNNNQQKPGQEENLELLNENPQQNSKNDKKRVRERTISEVIDKVKQWRTLFENGIPCPNMENQYQRLTLQQAAQKVGYSKKSLDNYHLQIKRGLKFGFDFQKHQNSKIGILRQFNIQQMKNNNDLSEVKLETQSSQTFDQDIFNIQNQQQDNNDQNNNQQDQYIIQQNKQDYDLIQQNQQDEYDISQYSQNAQNIFTANNNNLNNFDQSSSFLEMENNQQQIIEQNQDQINENINIQQQQYQENNNIQFLDCDQEYDNFVPQTENIENSIQNNNLEQPVFQSQTNIQDEGFIFQTQPQQIYSTFDLN